MTCAITAQDADDGSPLGIAHADLHGEFLLECREVRAVRLTISGSGISAPIEVLV